MRNRVFWSGRSWIVLATVFVAGMGVLASGQEQQGAATAAPNLERNMTLMNRALRTIKAGVSDKSKTEVTLVAVTQLQQATVAAKAQTPTSISKMSDGDEKNKMLRQYRSSMVKLFRQELDLEDQILAGESDKAATTITALEDAEKSGHKEFRVQ